MKDNLYEDDVIDEIQHGDRIERLEVLIVQTYTLQILFSNTLKIVF